MNDKRRLNRVRWTQNSPAGEGVSAENNSTPWSAFPMEGPPPQEEAVSPESNSAPWAGFQQGNAAPVESNPAPWAGFQQGNVAPVESNPAPWAGFQQGNVAPVENDPAPWSMFRRGGAFGVENNPTPWSAFQQEAAAEENAPAPWAGFQQGDVIPAEGYALGAEEPSMGDGVSYGHDLLAADFSEEDIYYDEEEYEEALATQQIQIQRAQERLSLRDSLLILVALYIICGIAPLFMGLFVPLRVFFWLEIGGWVIILAWLAIGVRPLLTKWFKERARMRKEQGSEQVSEQIGS